MPDIDVEYSVDWQWAKPNDKSACILDIKNRGQIKVTLVDVGYFARLTKFTKSARRLKEIELAFAAVGNMDFLQRPNYVGWGVVLTPWDATVLSRPDSATLLTSMDSQRPARLYLEPEDLRRGLARNAEAGLVSIEFFARDALGELHFSVPHRLEGLLSDLGSDYIRG